MGQVLIRNLDHALLADYRLAAKQNQRSLEAELRDALKRARPCTPKRRDELIELSHRIRAMTPKGIVQTPSEVLVRQMRDGLDESRT